MADGSRTFRRQNDIIALFMIRMMKLMAANPVPANEPDEQWNATADRDEQQPLNKNCLIGNPSAPEQARSIKTQEPQKQEWISENCNVVQSPKLSKLLGTYRKCVRTIDRNDPPFRVSGYA